MPHAKKVGVLIVDDSAAARQMLSRIIADHPHLDVVATAGDPFQAVEALKRVVPDVIVLDIEMPRMDGLTFLRRLMAQHPIPVVMCSSLVGARQPAMMMALEAGAVDVIQKPVAATRKFFEESAIRIRDTLLAASRVRLAAGVRSRGSHDTAPTEAIAAKALRWSPMTGPIVAIGASTGGTDALRQVLSALPPTAPPVLVVQHMPERFTAAFADRLNGLCALEVREARDGDRLAQGTALIAPGNHHMTIRRHAPDFRVRVDEGPLVNRHRPSVDVLFNSLAAAAGARTIGVILTGMGDDGARGMKQLRECGARTIGQDEATSIVYGMPREAFRLGAVETQLPIGRIAKAIIDCVAPGAR